MRVLVETASASPVCPRVPRKWKGKAAASYRSAGRLAQLLRSSDPCSADAGKAGKLGSLRECFSRAVCLYGTLRVLYF